VTTGRACGSAGGWSCGLGWIRVSSRAGGWSCGLGWIRVSSRAGGWSCGLGWTRVPGRRPDLGNRVDRGGSLIFGVRAAIGLGPLAGERRDHCGDGPVFKVGWRLDVRGKVLDDLADLAVFLDDALAVAAAGEMAVELGTLGRGQVAECEVEGVGAGELDVLLRKHRRRLAGWPARLAACRLPWPSGI
jgi:hypothetical protein